MLHIGSSENQCPGKDKDNPILLDGIGFLCMKYALSHLLTKISYHVGSAVPFALD